MAAMWVEDIQHDKWFSFAPKGSISDTLLANELITLFVITGITIAIINFWGMRQLWWISENLVTVEVQPRSVSIVTHLLWSVSQPSLSDKAAFAHSIDGYIKSPLLPLWDVHEASLGSISEHAEDAGPEGGEQNTSDTKEFAENNDSVHATHCHQIESYLT